MKKQIRCIFVIMLAVVFIVMLAPQSEIDGVLFYDDKSDCSAQAAEIIIATGECDKNRGEFF